MLLEKILRGALWTVGASLAARAVGLIGTLVLTRFLAPDVLGEVGVASILMLTAAELSNIGFGQYIVSNPRAGQHAVFHVTVLNVVSLLVVMPPTYLLAAQTGHWFGAPHMLQYLPGMALATTLGRLSVVPESLLMRDLRFREAALATAVPELVFTGVTLSLATAGYGGMSVVIGNVCQYALRLTLFSLLVDRRDWLSPKRLRKKRALRILSFGAPLAASNVASFAAAKWDDLIVSGMFGPKVLGTYNLAYNLASIPADHVGSAIGDVLMPSFAHMRVDEARRSLPRSLAAMALVLFPISVGLGAVSPTAVDLFFNEEWQSVAPFLMVLGPILVSAPIADGVYVYLSARNKTAPILPLSVLGTTALLSFVYLGGQLGPLFACIGAGLGGWVLTLAMIVLVARSDRVSAVKILSSLIAPTACSALMFGAVALFRQVLLPLEMTLWLRLILEVLVGALSYVLAIFLLARSTAFEVLAVARRALRRAQPSPPEESR